MTDKIKQILRRKDGAGFPLIIAITLSLVMVSLLFGTTAFAANGDVAGAIEGTWNDASGQIKTVVNKVVFPAIDLILAVFFFAKLGMAYFDYRKHEISQSPFGMPGNGCCKNH